MQSKERNNRDQNCSLGKEKEKFLFSFRKEQCYKLVTSLVGTSIFCALILKCQEIWIYIEK
jgi:hypothetical protein